VAELSNIFGGERTMIKGQSKREGGKALGYSEYRRAAPCRVTVSASAGG